MFKTRNFVLRIIDQDSVRRGGSESAQIVLESTRDDSDRTPIPLIDVTDVIAAPEQDDPEQFRIVTTNTEYVLYSRQRDRILTEIAIERSVLPIQLSTSETEFDLQTLRGSEVIKLNRV